MPERSLRRVLIVGASIAGLSAARALRRAGYDGEADRLQQAALAQVALLLTCPGVPDIYQGTEVWDSSLVDPDNRRPVDFASRGALLAELADAGPAETYARLLAHRRAYPGVYDRSSGYEPLEILGAHADRFVGFTRTGGLAVIVPRLVTSTADPWTGTEVILPSGRWVSVLTGHQVEGGRLRAATLLRQFPVQVLARDV